MRHSYSDSDHETIHWLELITLLTACSLSIVMLYQIFVAPNWRNLEQVNSTLSWTSLIR
jgi:hypothetical protein